jgi:hypothetical protein
MPLPFGMRPVGIDNGMPEQGQARMPNPLQPAVRRYGGDVLQQMGQPLQVAPVAGKVAQGKLINRQPTNFPAIRQGRQHTRDVLTSVSGPIEEANVPQKANLGYSLPGHGGWVPGNVRAQHTNPLFGRPGVAYWQAASMRAGPVPKLAPGTGGSQPTRSNGFVPGNYAASQFIPLTQFDYLPANDPDVNLYEGTGTFTPLPRNVGYGDDGLLALNPTYRAHDFTPADRFFNQGRSAAAWQDCSFGPFYRYLQPNSYATTMSRYPVANQIRLARPLSQNAYFLGYQTQSSVSQSISATPQSNPLGYGS